MVQFLSLVFLKGGPLTCKVTNDETGLIEEKTCNREDDMCVVEKSFDSLVYNCTNLAKIFKRVKNFDCDRLPSKPGCFRVVRLCLHISVLT